MFNKKAENKINVFKLQYYSLKSKPRPLGVLLVLVFCIFHTLSTVSKLTELSLWCDPIRPFFIYWRQNSGQENPKQTATEDNAWQETQHLVSIIFRLTRVVSQITVQSAKMAVKCYCNMSIIVVNRGKKPSIIQILEDQTVSPYVTLRKMIFNLSHFQGWTIYAKNSRVLIKVFGELKLQTAFCKNLTIEPLIYVVSGNIIGKTDYYSNQSAYKRIK